MSSNKGVLLFDKDYRNSVKINRETFHAFYGVYCHFLKLILNVKDEIIKETEIKVDGKFNKAFLVLLNRSIQHTESIMLLAERGLYGDAFGLYRNIISDSNMFYYLHFKPELIDDFLSESQDSYQMKDGEFKKQFSEYAIATELKTRGVKSTGNIFNLFSKAAHASAYGAQLYSRRSTDSQDLFHLKYGPQLERERSLIVLFITMQTHKDTLNGLLWHREERHLDVTSNFWATTFNDAMKMDKDITKLTTLTMDALDKMSGRRV
jgi:hypothetical protein